MWINISLPRLWAMIIKEFIQMKRDRFTLGMIVAIPLIQIFLFGYAINNDPKHLPTAIIASDNSSFTRAFIAGMQNTNYFHFIKTAKTETEAHDWLQKGEVQFVVNVPANFTHDVIRGLKPSILVEADATDPSATSNAIAALNQLTLIILSPQLTGSLNYLAPTTPPFQVIIHPLYNPTALTQYNIVPGLMGLVLTMTMVMITSMAIAREREQGTLENLLSTPVQPVEVMLGKVLPYIILGYVQALLILLMSKYLFNVPMRGSAFLLIIVLAPFIIANLVVGLLFSTITKTQLQAAQMTTFFFLPSILLSGFMFPFYGMPLWAQIIGEALPLTHFLRIVRGIMLKNNGWLNTWPELWPILLFLLILLIFGIKRYRRTLDE